LSNNSNSSSSNNNVKQIACNDLNSLINFRNQQQKPIKLKLSPLQVTPSIQHVLQKQQNPIKIVHLSTVQLQNRSISTNPMTKYQQQHQNQQQQQIQAKIIQMPKIISSTSTRQLPYQTSTTRVSPSFVNDRNVQITKVVSSRINNTETPIKQQSHLRSHIYYNPLTSISNASHYLNSNLNTNNLQTPLIRVTNNNQENNGYSKFNYHQNGRNNYTNMYYDQFDEEIVVDEEEELGHAETYADYMPSKLKLGN
jgi:hypothetical protein